MSHQRKKPTVMPARASYGTAREGNHPSERPIGSTPKLGAEPRVWTARLLAALDKRGQRRQGNRPEHQCRLAAAVAEPGLFACKVPMTRPPVLSQVRPPTGEPDAGDPHVRFGGRGSRTQSALPTPILSPRHQPARICKPLVAHEKFELVGRWVPAFAGKTLKSMCQF